MTHTPLKSTPVATPPALPECALLRLPQVLSVIPVARSTWWAGVRAGRFPRPVRLGPRSVAWKAADIRALVERLSNHEAAEGDS